MSMRRESRSNTSICISLSKHLDCPEKSALGGDLTHPRELLANEANASVGIWQAQSSVWIQIRAAGRLPTIIRQCIIPCCVVQQPGNAGVHRRVRIQVSADVAHAGEAGVARGAGSPVQSQLVESTRSGRNARLRRECGRLSCKNTSFFRTAGAQADNLRTDHSVKLNVQVPYFDPAATQRGARITLRRC